MKKKMKITQCKDMNDFMMDAVYCDNELLPCTSLPPPLFPPQAIMVLMLLGYVFLPVYIASGVRM